MSIAAISTLFAFPKFSNWSLSPYLHLAPWKKLFLRR
jgi:hypothetical protein